MSFIKRKLSAEERKKLQTHTIGESRTKQSFKKQSDINVIMKKYERTGLITHTKQNGAYGDFSDVKDYHAALNAIYEANEGFMTLPASLRKRFGNDPAQLIEFLNDANNLEEAVELGLVEKPVKAPSQCAGETEGKPSEMDKNHSGSNSEPSQAIVTGKLY